MKLDSFHHIAVICSDKTAALEFYHEKLSFRIIRERTFGRRRMTER